MTEHIKSAAESERIAADVLNHRTTHLLHDFEQEPISEPVAGDVVYVSTPQGTWRYVVRGDGSWMPNDEEE